MCKSGVGKLQRNSAHETHTPKPKGGRVMRTKSS